MRLVMIMIILLLFVLGASPGMCSNQNGWLSLDLLGGSGVQMSDTDFVPRAEWQVRTLEGQQTLFVAGKGGTSLPLRVEASETSQNLALLLEYYDTGEGSMTIQYATPFGTRDAMTIARRGDNRWRTVIAPLPFLRSGSRHFDISIMLTNSPETQQMIRLRQVVVFPSMVMVEPRKLGWFTGSDPCELEIVLSAVAGNGRPEAKIDWEVEALGEVVEAGSDSVDGGDMDKVTWNRTLMLPPGLYTVRYQVAVPGQPDWHCEGDLMVLHPIEGDGDRLCLGIQHKFGMQTLTEEELRHDFSLLADLGVSWVRGSFIWPRIETQLGIYSYPRHYDQAVSLAQAYGINIMGLVGGSCAFYDGGTPPKSELALAAWQSYVKQTVERYGHHIKAWEIWNEPSLSMFWGGGPVNPKEYVSVLEAAYDAVKFVDEEASVIGITLGGFSPQGIEFLNRVLEQDRAQHLDVVSVHAYPCYSARAPEDYDAYVNHIAYTQGKLLEVQAKDTPVWLTETGYPTFGGYGGVDQYTQGAYVVRAALLLLDAGVERVFWYEMYDSTSGQEEERHHGLIDAFGRPKPALFAYHQLLYFLAGRQLVGIDVVDGVYSAMLRGNEEDVMVVWMENGTSHKEISGAARVYSLYSGVPLEVGETSLTIDIGEIPVFVVTEN